MTVMLCYDGPSDGWHDFVVYFPCTIAVLSPKPSKGEKGVMYFELPECLATATLCSGQTFGYELKAK